METRFMQVMFSATENQDEELMAQVANDVEAAKTEGSFEDDEVTYVNLGSGKVLVIDKENGESTVIEEDPENAEGYSLEGFENKDEALEKYLHPLNDGVTPDENVQTEETENVEEDHLGGEEISESVPDVTVEENAEGGEVCPECGKAPCECEEEEEEQHEFSNTAMAKLFSDSEFYCRIFSEVVAEDKPAFIGDLKIEIDEENPETIIVTDVESGDAAQVNINEEGEAIVNELQKECSEEEQYEPLYVVGVNADTNELVDAQVYGEEEANELAQRYQEIGIEGIGIFDDQLEAQEHAAGLLGELGITELEAHAEPEEHAFSDMEGISIYTTKYFSVSPKTAFMERLYSEAEEEITDSQDVIEDAIGSGEQVEDGNLVITPISSEAAIVADKDNGEYTKVILDEDELDIEKIDEEEADELTQDLEIGEGEEKTYSEYEIKLSMYSEAQDEVADAIKEGKEVDDDEQKITPISDDTAIVYDKENDEFTKVVLDEEENLETAHITEEEAEAEINAEEAEEEGTQEENAEEEKEEEKEYSTLDKFFADVVVNPETGDPIEEAAAPVEGEEVAPVSVEGIEDKAFEAVQSIQEAANNAVLAIQEAKEAPAPGEEEDLKEAHFSETENKTNGTLGDWLSNI